MNTKSIGKMLADAYIDRSEQQLELDRAKAELFKREIALTPIEGWPGKNAELREVEKSRTLATDEAYQKFEALRVFHVEALTLINGTIEALEAERRGSEWEIRANLVTVMAGKLRGETLPSVEDAAFDDASEGELEQEIFYVGDLEDHPTPLETVEDELPF